MLDVAVAVALRFGLLLVGLLRTSSYWQRIAIWMIIAPIDWHLFNSLDLLSSPEYEGPKYILGAAVAGAQIMAANLLVFIRNPQDMVRKLDANGKPEPFPEDLSGQLEWVTGIMTSPRYVGYTYAVPHLKPAFSFNPFIFVLFKLFHISTVTLSTFVAWVIAIRLGFAESLRPVPLYPSDTLWENIWRSVGTTILSIWTGYWVIGTTYDLTALISVALGSSPRGWPDIFGYVEEATTVAKAWGRVWHQTVRRMGTPIADFVTEDILGLRRRSTLWTILQTILVFAMSDVVHTAGDYAVSKGKMWWSPTFFMLQPLAFFFEAGVAYLFGRVGVTSARFPWMSRMVGYIWVVGWFSATFPMFMSGFWRDNYFEKFIELSETLF